MRSKPPKNPKPTQAPQPQAVARAQALFQQALALHQGGHLAPAQDLYEQVLQLQPRHFDALHLSGLALRPTGDPARGAELMRQALALHPTSAAARSNLGLALQDLGQAPAALACFEQAIALQPDFASAHRNRGDVLQVLGRHADAIDAYRTALRLKPDLVEAWVNLGNAHQSLGQHEAALTCYDQALARSPRQALALGQRGTALRELRRHDEALANYEQLLTLQPDNHRERSNLGLYCLQLEQFSRGWDLAGAEWLLPDYAHRAGRFGVPPWQGVADGARLLAWGVQGLGDQILHLGMLGDMQERVSALGVAVDARLGPLVQRSFPGVAVHALEPPIDARSEGYDSQLPLSRLGEFVRRNRADFPTPPRPYLRADPDRARALRARLAADGKLVCGLSWASTNPRLEAFKNPPLEALAPVLGLPGVRFVDLQYGDTAAQRHALREHQGVDLVHLEDVDNTQDIDGLAALIEACDVVVTISNTTAHIAGALGKPVLLMLPYTRGVLWYWHEQREDSPWYPGVRIVRQQQRGDWGDVAQRVAEVLQQKIRETAHAAA